MDNVALIIEQFIVDEILNQNGSRIDHDQSLIGSGILDSLAFLQLVGFLEEQFGITADDDELVPENFDTITRIKAFIEGKMGKNK